MILTGPAIRAAYEAGEIEIDPFDPERLNPASYDLELGEEAAVYSVQEQMIVRAGTHYEHVPAQPRYRLDSKRQQDLTVFRMSPYGFTVEPGGLYLMHTRERIHTKRYVPIIDGKSSIGRLGLFIHVTAGYGDPGFDGQYTLEVASIAHPVVIYPGMKFCQIRFHAMQGAAPDYQERGNYTGADARGPVRSASWRQFR